MLPAVILKNLVIVQMELEIIHFVIGHKFGVILQEVYREKLASYIKHKTAFSILREILRYPFYNACLLRILLQNL
ncbi:hypothetical protein D3C71_1629400 [compost metagenome]